MNPQALRNLLAGTRQKIKMIDADLASLSTSPEPWSGDRMYSQGYQTGRKAELESLATTLEMALAAMAAS